MKSRRGMRRINAPEESMTEGVISPTVSNFCQCSNDSLVMSVPKFYEVEAQLVDESRASNDVPVYDAVFVIPRWKRRTVISVMAVVVLVSVVATIVWAVKAKNHYLPSHLLSDVPRNLVQRRLQCNLQSCDCDGRKRHHCSEGKPKICRGYTQLLSRANGVRQSLVYAPLTTFQTFAFQRIPLSQDFNMMGQTIPELCQYSKETLLAHGVAPFNELPEFLTKHHPSGRP